MNLVDIIVALILLFSLIGGLKDGAVKSMFNLAATVIAIPIAGAFYYLAATILAFLPGSNWENLVGFFITLAIATIILQLIFWLPRKMIGVVWHGGLIYRLIGAFASLLNAGIGLTVATTVLLRYPAVDWLVVAVGNSGILQWLAATLGFVSVLLPATFRGVAARFLHWRALPG